MELAKAIRDLVVRDLARGILVEALYSLNIITSST